MANDPRGWTSALGRAELDLRFRDSIPIPSQDYGFSLYQAIGKPRHSAGRRFDSAAWAQQFGTATGQLFTSAAMNTDRKRRADHLVRAATLEADKEVVSDLDRAVRRLVEPVKRVRNPHGPGNVVGCAFKGPVAWALLKLNCITLNLVEIIVADLLECIWTQAENEVAKVLTITENPERVLRGFGWCLPGRHARRGS